MSAIPQYTTTTLETANERDLYIVVLSQISASNDYKRSVIQFTNLCPAAGVKIGLGLIKLLEETTMGAIGKNFYRK